VLQGLQKANDKRIEERIVIKATSLVDRNSRCCDWCRFPRHWQVCACAWHATGTTKSESYRTLGTWRQCRGKKQPDERGLSEQLLQQCHRWIVTPTPGTGSDAAPSPLASTSANMQVASDRLLSDSRQTAVRQKADRRQTCFREAKDLCMVVTSTSSQARSE
jgi:hypothetical protein